MTEEDFRKLQARVLKNTRKPVTPQGAAEKRRSKYNAKRTEVDDISFHSKAEAEYYKYLKLLKAAGEIVRFHRQVIFDLPGGVTFRCDFQEIYPGGKIRYIDVKGVKTRSFIDKAKMIKTIYGIKIIIVQYNNKGFFEEEF